MMMKVTNVTPHASIQHKNNTLNTYKLKKQKHLIWNKYNNLRKQHAEVVYSSWLLTFREFSPGNLEIGYFQNILHKKYEW